MAGAAGIPCRGMGLTTWKRLKLARGLESDRCFYFRPEKIAGAARVARTTCPGFPTPTWASRSISLGRPSIARGFTPRFSVLRSGASAKQAFIERLTPEGHYVTVDTSQFLPVSAETSGRWIVDEDLSDEIAWTERLQAEIRARMAKGSLGEND